MLEDRNVNFLKLADLRSLKSSILFLWQTCCYVVFLEQQSTNTPPNHWKGVRRNVTRHDSEHGETCHQGIIYVCRPATEGELFGVLPKNHCKTLFQFLELFYFYGNSPVLLVSLAFGVAVQNKIMTYNGKCTWNFTLPI